MPTATPVPLMPELTRDVYADYGLYGLLLVLIVFFVLPPLVKKVMPFLFKGWQDEKLRAEKREERQIQAMESLAAATQGINVTLAAVNVRLQGVETDISTVKDVLLITKPAEKKTRPKVPALMGE